MRRLTLAVTVLALCASLGRARAQNVAPVPPLTGPVVDQTQLVGPYEPELTQELLEIDRLYGVQLAVLVVPTTQPEPIETYAHRVMEAWHLGRARADTGLLLLVATQDRATRLEVGYGLEGVLPDAVAKRILATTLRPSPGMPLTARHLHHAVATLRQTLRAAQDEGLMPTADGTPARAPSIWDHPVWLGALVVALLATPLLMRSLRRMPGSAPGEYPGETSAYARLPAAPSPGLLSLIFRILAALLMGGRGGPPDDRDPPYRGGGGRSGGGGAGDRF